MISSKEAARLVDWPNPNRAQELENFVLNASAGELQAFVHLIETDTTDAREWKVRSRIALDISLADESAKTAQKLVEFGEKQAESAKILEHYARTLIRLTWALVWLAVVLFIVTIGFAILDKCQNPKYENNNPSEKHNPPHNF